MKKIYLKYFLTILLFSILLSILPLSLHFLLGVTMANTLNLILYK